MLICLGIFMSAKTAHRASLIEWLLWCMVCTLLGHIPKLPYLLKKYTSTKSPSIAVGLDFPKLLGGIVVILTSSPC